MPLTPSDCVEVRVRETMPEAMPQAPRQNLSNMHNNIRNA